MNFNPLKKTLRKMQYIADQKGILTRYFNEKSGWDFHLNMCKDFISKTINKADTHSIAVLGSGWLLDFPEELLLNNGIQITLFDIRHPKEIVHKYRKQNNITFVECDITGGAINQCYQAVENWNRHKTKTSLLEVTGVGFKPNAAFDVVISLNIMNQLNILAVDFLKRNKIYSADELHSIAKNIQQNHLNSLRTGDILIADYEELVFKKNDTPEKHTTSIFVDLPKGKQHETWDWQFDLSGNYYPGKKTIFKVMGIQL